MGGHYCQGWDNYKETTTEIQRTRYHLILAPLTNEQTNEWSIHAYKICQRIRPQQNLPNRTNDLEN